MKLPFFWISFSERVMVGSPLRLTIATAALLMLALGCHHDSQVGDVRPADTITPSRPDHQSAELSQGMSKAESNAQRPQKENTNFAPAALPDPTNGAIGNANSNALIAIWRSSDSSPQERANALTKWLPKDTGIVKAEALLGHDGRLSHYFGPLFTSGQSTNAPGSSSSLDECVLQFNSPRGPVSVVFSKRPESPNQFLFDRAFPGAY